ncbi:hypothetical protein SAMN04489712_104107 [Thermomonospora echinospora]|uniref:Uncharacterized protein n=1 Tax=Thermomonospora echinospora TaxID=1992 RepID=A0A1H5YNS3_9ACTN|nr:hypothetical protein [Thermomonospora echinospora]SEG25779.1 hypothetical protein SAMN04489712_104107 [Thermomonospora echinospora]
MDSLFRLLAEGGPVTWVAALGAAVIVALVFYLGVAMFATLISRDQRRGKMRYRVFLDLLELFQRRGPR